MATPQHETRCGMDRGESSSLQLLQETTHLNNSRRNMSSTGGLIANNSLSMLQLETIIISKERLVAAVLHLYLGFFSWNLLLLQYYIILLNSLFPGILHTLYTVCTYNYV